MSNALRIVLMIIEGIVAGAIMMGWIIGEVLILKQPSPTWIEAGYFVTGILMAGLGFTLARI